MSNKNKFVRFVALLLVFAMLIVMVPELSYHFLNNGNKIYWA